MMIGRATIGRKKSGRFIVRSLCRMQEIVFSAVAYMSAARGMSQIAESAQLRLLRRDRREIMYDSFIEIWEG